jgi:hypothetical protein
MKNNHECPECGHHHHHCGSCGAPVSHEECCHEHSECHDSHDQDFAHKLIELADQAWMEVLQEEIRTEIRSTHGKHLKELAKQASDTNSERWKHKMALEKVNKDFKDKLCQLFSSKS